MNTFAGNETIPFSCCCTGISAILLPERSTAKSLASLPGGSVREICASPQAASIGKRPQASSVTRLPSPNRVPSGNASVRCKIRIRSDSVNCLPSAAIAANTARPIRLSTCRIPALSLFPGGRISAQQAGETARTIPFSGASVSWPA